MGRLPPSVASMVLMSIMHVVNGLDRAMARLARAMGAA
jgi:hypothetical protein